MQNIKPTIAVVGLGYVGLPLAVALARNFEVKGFDIDQQRVEELKRGFDRTLEIDEEAIRLSSLRVTSKLLDIKGSDVFIITVPTPITSDNLPDLSPLEKASAAIGSILEDGNIVVYESTVYPGVTEDVCGPILEQHSGLESGKSFFLGYSPERINPGDRVHTVDQITKIVSAQNRQVLDLLAIIYGTMNEGRIFCAKSIKTAEAAKVIENAQRDINIAFINEVTSIFGKMGISVYDVLEAAKTKWNFLPFTPGLVGGHCIGVDPYYLAYLSRRLGHEPEVILAGRKTNESMSRFFAESIHQEWLSICASDHTKNPKTLVMGLTFKEDVPDLRNTKIVDMVAHLRSLGHDVVVHDPLASTEEAKQHCGLDIVSDLPMSGDFDVLVGAVPHHAYKLLSNELIEGLLSGRALIADIRHIWPGRIWSDHIQYWCL